MPMRNDGDEWAGDFFGVPESVAYHRERSVRRRPEPATRHGDPETSHQAEHTARRRFTENQRKVLEAFQAAAASQGERFLGYTDEQLVDAMEGSTRMTDSSIRTRRSELVIRGKLRDTGRKGLTRAGGKTIVWGLPPTNETAKPPTEQ